MDNLYSVREVAARLGGLSRWTIYSWLGKGKLHKTKVGRRTMIAEGDIQAFVNSCNPPSTKQEA